MIDDTLIQIEVETRRHFPAYASAELSLAPLEKGGSDRKFYRISAPGLSSLIFVQYGSQKEENRHYVEIGAFLEGSGVRVPKMFVHEAEEGRIWMEDLGELDLWSFRGEPWAVRKRLYEAALREAHRLHYAARANPGEAARLLLQPGFDSQLYHWEQDYFFTHCASRHLGLETGVLEPARARLHDIALELAGMPRSLVHRDFQSQNIVVHNGEPCLIDFQGMRHGLPQYDLASLLLDPYTDLLDSERDELLDFYCYTLEGMAAAEAVTEFKRIYHLCAAQRLMQALGAYGFLGYEKGRTHFLSHIPIALARLSREFEGVGGLSSLAALLNKAAAHKDLPLSAPAAATAH